MTLRSAAVIALLLAAPVAAQQGRDSTHALDTVRVSGRIDDLTGVARTASEGRVGASELRARPLMREGELLESVPGVIVTQHSGDGKANQYFVRGFNLDHGTDFQTRLDGMPLNMPTHAHGQGYTDLNFVIPELVDHIEYKLGVSHPEIGDFGSAGAAEFHLVSALEHPVSMFSTGQHGFNRLVLGESWRMAGGTLLLAGEGKTYDGPWQLPEALRKLSGVARFSIGAPTTRLSVTALAYHNDWRASDQIPARAVTDGLVSRYGQLDTTDGGATQRYSLSASLQHVASSSLQRADVYVVYSDLALFSDFTYFLDDPVRGDQFSQTEGRVITGGSASHEQHITDTQSLTIGAEQRSDFINGLGLNHTEGRAAFAAVRNDAVRELSAGAFASVTSQWTQRLRSTIGARTDGYYFDVHSDDERNSGHRTAAIVTPKLSLAYRAADDLELYFSAGEGFHSNDARGATLTVDPVTKDPAIAVSPLVRSRGGEVGLRATSQAGLRSTLTLWTLALDSELLFAGDAGTTESSAASRRYGVTVANFYRPRPSLSLDADLSLSHASLLDVDAGQSHVPGALENVLAAGVTYEPVSPGVFGAVRLRQFGSYPLTEDGQQRASASRLVNIDAGYRLHSGARIQVAVLNALNASANDIQYAYTSRLRGETSDGVSDVHFHPAEPRQVRMSIDLRW